MDWAAPVQVRRSHPDGRRTPMLLKPSRTESNGELLMASQSLRPNQTPRERRQRGHSHAVTTSLFRYQLNVIAASVADVVQSAGGWLFDRRMAGWEVNILLSEQDDARAIRILGATTVDLRSGLAYFLRGPERAAAHSRSLRICSRSTKAFKRKCSKQCDPVSLKLHSG